MRPADFSNLLPLVMLPGKSVISLTVGAPTTVKRTAGTASMRMVVPVTQPSKLP